MIEISNLTKSYGAKKAVDDISFTVNKGEILGFLGPNGAGKSTTMNIITGYISSTSGSVKVDGHDILEEPNEVKKRIGYLPEQPPLYMDMRVIDYLSFVYELKKIKLPDRLGHIQSIIDTVQIDDVKGRKIANLSKGYKQRVGLAQALLGNPEVLILDEPTVGLDPRQILEIRNVIKELGRERTIILSSHILSEVSAVCERVIIINKGRLVAEDTPENLSRKFTGKSRLQLRIMGEEQSIYGVLSAVEGVSEVVSLGQKETGTYDFEIDGDAAFDSEFLKNLFLLFAQKEMPVIMQKEVGATLEDIFIQLTENQSGAEDTESADTDLDGEQPDSVLEAAGEPETAEADAADTEAEDTVLEAADEPETAEAEPEASEDGEGGISDESDI